MFPSDGPLVSAAWLAERGSDGLVLADVRWRTDLSAATEAHHLPTAATRYVELLQDQVGVPIHLIGVGPARDQYVHVA